MVIVHMNWVDIVIIIVLTYYAYKGLRLGLVSSIFRVAGFLLSVYIAIRYYYSIYEFIIDNSFLYEIFEKITEGIIRLLFHSWISKSPDFILRLLSEGFIKLIIAIASIALIFFLSNMFIKAVLSIFSLLFRIPILKGINKAGGMIFGLVQGVFVIYFFNLIFNELYAFFPDSRLGEAIYNSLILTYLQTVDIFKFLLDFGSKNYI